MKFLKELVWKTTLAFRGDILSNFEKLKNWQWLPENEIHSLQRERLKRLLMHAYRHVPYYREVLSDIDVVNNSEMVKLEYFSQIPLLDKSIIRSHYEDLKSDDLAARKWYENTSGGSSGEPVRLIQDSYYHQFSTSIVILHDLWSGYSMSEKKIVLWGSMRDLLIGKETLKTRSGRWLRNEVWLNSLHMTPEQMHSYVECINDFRPVQILAYAEGIYELSRFIEREKLDVYSPKSIMTSAGVLHPHMRELIKTVFKAPVFNRYGSREVGNIACECDHHQGLHISPTQYVEILRKDGSRADPGEVGEIVITLLTNYAMPIIRYRIGDMGAWAEKPCTCGRTWPLLKEVTGRVTDSFVTKNGTIVQGFFFILVLFFQDWIRKYQVIQEDYDFVRVLIVLYEKVNNPLKAYMKEIRTITGKICMVMGQDCQVKFEFVDEIAPTASGKYRYIISKVKFNEN